MVRSALLLLVVALQALGVTSAAAATPPRVVAVGTVASDGSVRITVELDGVTDAALPPERFSATVDGAPQPARVVPVLSDELAIGLVVDGSEAGASALQAGISGATDFLLAMPPSTRAALLVDRAPPEVMSALQPGPDTVLPALSGGLQPGGTRQTADALELAARQLPAETAPHLVLLYTSAPDAGGEPAPDLAARLTRAGALLTVVTATGEPASPYWSSVAAATGGLAVGAPPSAAVQAFDRAASAMRDRYLLTFPAPGRLPATVSVTVATASGPLTTDVVVPVPAPDRAAPSSGGGGTADILPLAFGAAGLVLLALVVVVAVRLRAGRRAGSVDRRRSEHRSEGRAWNVPARSDRLAERPQLLDAVSDTLRSHRRAVLHAPAGRAGVGRTVSLIEYVHRHRDEYDVAWWIPSTDPALIPNRMAELAQTLELASATDSMEVATERLLAVLRHRDRWLLVFDDAANPWEIARFLCDGPGHVAITSPDSGWGDVASPIPVGTFSRAESVGFLRSGLPHLAVEQADRIASVLEDLPLALDPAAGLLRDAGMDADVLLTRLTDRMANIDAAGGCGGLPASLAAAWALACERLQADDPVALALLIMAAWLGPEPMPLALLSRNPDQLRDVLRGSAGEQSGLPERAATLGRRGLARVTADAVELHQVPAAVLVARTGHTDPTGLDWAATAVRVLRAALPDAPADDPATWPSWRRLLPHVVVATDPLRALDIVAGDVSWLLSQAATYLAARGQARLAVALLEDAYEIQQRRLGEDHPDTVAVARGLAACIQAAGGDGSGSAW